ncbi:hypothetical protein [Hydrogenimonas sp.]
MSEISELLHLIKQNYDIVLMAVGLFLIVIGLMLFITGRYSDNENHVEGFGIKMDVKNPSLILIIFGVFLLVAPMTLNKKEHPAQTATETAQTAPPGKTGSGVAETSVRTSVETKRHDEAPQPPVASVTPSSPPKTSPPKPVLPALQGTYRLLTYMEDNMPINTAGELVIQRVSNGIFPFRANFQVADGWGNVALFLYEGYFAKRNGQWYLKVNSTNEPEWTDLGEVNLQLILDNNSGTLGLRYYYGADIASVWQKVR